MKTLELHGAIDWSDDFLKTLLVDRNLTSSVFCENLVSLTLENVAINAKELVDFVESFVLPRPKKERLEKFLEFIDIDLLAGGGAEVSWSHYCCVITGSKEHLRGMIAGGPCCASAEEGKTKAAVAVLNFVLGLCWEIACISRWAYVGRCWPLLSLST